jgi:hypothetical protein
VRTHTHTHTHTHTCARAHTHTRLSLHDVLKIIHINNGGWDSSVGIVTGYGLDGPEIFSTRPDRSWDLPGLLYDGYWFFPGGKAAGVWC